MNTISVYPGSFDPVTNGHLDIIERAAKLFDKVYVVVSINAKKNCLFTVSERLELLRDVTKHLDNVIIDSHNSLIIDYANEKGARVLIRGIRAISDFEYEFKLFSFNHDLDCNIETVILLAKNSHMFLTSSDIKELAKFNGDISKFVPDIVNKKLTEKYRK